MARTNIGSIATSTYTAGRVYIMPFEIPNQCVVTGVDFGNAATIAGNITVGIYSEVTKDTPAGGTLLGSSASTAHANANNGQTINFANPIVLGAGVYYIAFEVSDATATIYKSQTVWLITPNSFVYDRGGGYGTLTDPCPAVSLSTSQPFIALNVQ